MISLKTEADILAEVAAVLRSQRVALRWRQQDLANRSGVSIATLQRFEQSGEITFRGLATLLVTLGLADQFLNALKRPESAPKSIEDFLASGTVAKPPQRVRRSRTS